MRFRVVRLVVSMVGCSLVVSSESEVSPLECCRTAPAMERGARERFPRLVVRNAVALALDARRGKRRNERRTFARATSQRRAQLQELALSSACRRLRLLRAWRRRLLQRRRQRGERSHLSTMPRRNESGEDT